MTRLLRDPLAGLARGVADLTARVRTAVAGELARAVGQAVRQVVQALAAGRPDPEAPDPAYDRPRAGRWADDPNDDWDRSPAGWTDDPDDDPGRGPGDAVRPGLTAAVAAGVAAARWWVGRRGTLAAAAAVGVGVGLLGVLGGPVARTAVAVLAAAADVLAATDALGTAATRLDPP